MKKCSRCKTEKNFSEFNKHKSIKDGFQNFCKVCFKQYVSENKERVHKLRKLWVENNRERSRQHKTKWRLNNKDYWPTWKNSNINNKIAHNLRCRIGKALRKITKSKKTMDLLGISIEEIGRAHV